MNATVFWSIAAFATVGAGIGAAWLLDRGSQRAEQREEQQRRRPADPQCGAAGTGVEPLIRRSDYVGAAVLPRSHLTSAGTDDPRPSVPAGLHLPAGVATPPAEAQPRPDALPPSAALAGLQLPVGLTGHPPVPTGTPIQVVRHG